MRAKLLILTFWLFTGQAVFCQEGRSIGGQVLDDASGEPIGNCSVFINNTVKGTVTGASGKFDLTHIGPGKYELVVSSVGYESYVHAFSADQLPLQLIIRLRRKTTDLSAITVDPFVADGWATYGQTFINVVIGETPFSRQCEIKNKEVVRFRFSSKKNQMAAVADEPIIIENKALGYVIQFQLEECKVDFNNNTSVFLGYFQYSEMTTASGKKKAEWDENRRSAYYGSIMHFVRSLYSNGIQRITAFNQEGFDLRRQVRVSNTEKQRVAALNALARPADSVSPDSLKYYKKVLREADSVSQNQLLTADDLVSPLADTAKSLFFPGKLSVTYRRKRKTDTEVEKSTIYLLTPAPVQIESNGYYNSPLEIFTIGYWASSQKVANLLPLDYDPGE